MQVAGKGLEEEVEQDLRDNNAGIAHGATLALKELVGIEECVVSNRSQSREQLLS